VGEWARAVENVGMSFWKHRKVMVTGTTGLLGSWLTEALLDAGAEVISLVRDWVPNSRAITAGVLDRCTVVRGDLEDLAVVTRTINEYEVDSVFHLGAQGGVWIELYELGEQGASIAGAEVSGEVLSKKQEAAVGKGTVGV
jgi:CDP-glucose 4,6-dehydratase